MFRRIVCLLALGAALIPVSAARRAFAIEDLYRLQSPSSPSISPDGKSIAFALSQPDMKKGKTRTNIWCVAPDGSRLRRLTASDGSDTAPRWSPDGRFLLFLSSRKDDSQAWILPADGGEARQVTRFPGGIGDAAWMPDGKSILFTAQVFPECGADAECNRKIQDGLDKGPLQAHMADHLLYRHWTDWADGRRTHLLLTDLEGSRTVDLTPGDYDSPAFSLDGGGGFDVSPDGTEICVVSQREDNEATSTNKDLWLIPVRGGEARNITAANRGADGSPRYSPDGRYLAWLAQATEGYESDCFRLTLMDRKSGATRILTESFDNWVTDFRWAPDSRSILFSSGVKGLHPVFRLDVASGTIAQVASRATLGLGEVAPDGTWAAGTRSSVGEPSELCRISLKDGEVKLLTSFNQTVSEEVDIRPAECIWVKGAQGADIQVFIVKPHDFDPAKKYPLILNIHGGPQMMWSDSFRGDWQVYPGAGYVVAFPNVTGSTGYGQAFTAAISRDWNGRVMQDVSAVTDALAALPYVDANRMGAMGWSWGGYAMMWLEGHTERFKALAAMMGVYDLPSMHGATEELWFPEWDLGGRPWDSALYEKLSPSRYVTGFKTPCLVLTGERDYRVPYTQSLQFFTDLQLRRVPSRLIVFKNDGHWPNGIKSMPFYYNAHLDWFHRYLGGAPAPYDMKKMWRNLAFEEATPARP